MTPLLIAIDDNDGVCLQYISECGADINVRLTRRSALVMLTLDIKSGRARYHVEM